MKLIGNTTVPVQHFSRLLLNDAAKALNAPPSKESPYGYLEGYVAAFDNVDRVGDRIVRGAFTKTIKERLPLGRIPLMSRHFAHGGDGAEAIGLITQAREDDYGLWVHAEYSSDSEAQRIRKKIDEGIIWGMSIGYEIIRYSEVKEGDRYILELEELKLLEGTVTCNPANENAIITAAKSLSKELGADGTYRGSLSHSAIETLKNSVDNLLAVLAPFEPKAMRTTKRHEVAVGAPDFTLMEEALEERKRELELFGIDF